MKTFIILSFWKLDILKIKTKFFFTCLESWTDNRFQKNEKDLSNIKLIIEQNILSNIR
jgi:hypothetical protein